MTIDGQKIQNREARSESSLDTTLSHESRSKQNKTFFSAHMRIVPRSWIKCFFLAKPLNVINTDDVNGSLSLSEAASLCPLWSRLKSYQGRKKKFWQKSNSIKTSRKTARPPGAMKTSATIPGARNGAFATSGDKRPNIKTCQLLLSLLHKGEREREKTEVASTLLQSQEC